MPRKQLPPVEFLEECFSVSDGFLIWKTRPRHHFKNDSVMKATNTRFSGKVAGFKTENGYTSVRLCNSLFLAHRILFKILHGLEPESIDHIDRDKSNNASSNLRVITGRGNSENSSKVSYSGNNHQGKFRVRVRYNYKLYSIGCYHSLEEAKKVYEIFQEKVGGKDLTPEEVERIVTSLKQEMKEKQKCRIF